MPVSHSFQTTCLSNKFKRRHSNFRLNVSCVAKLFRVVEQVVATGVTEKAFLVKRFTLEGQNMYLFG